MPTSKLQRKVKNELFKHFYYYHIYENYRPEWMLSQDNKRLELDFFIEELRVAIEVQGEQHYVFCPFFHKSYDNFLEQKQRDKEKQPLCTENNVRFFIVSSRDEIKHLIRQICKLENSPISTKRFIETEKRKHQINELNKTELCLHYASKIRKIKKSMRRIRHSKKSRSKENHRHLSANGASLKKNREKLLALVDDPECSELASFCLDNLDRMK